jgi:hypothetical protein
VIYHIDQKENEMSRITKITFLIVFVLASLACGLISNPLNDAQNLASTAEAVATSNPIGTLQAITTSMPDATQYLNPTGTPVKVWNTIPIMTQATAGQEFNKNTYSYKASGITATDVQTFYSDQLKTLGWSSTFSAQGGSQGGVMFFTKDTNTITITITTQDPNVVVLLIYQ